MNLQTQIRQQQATVQGLEKLLKAKRVSQDELDQAKVRLADLERQTSFKPLAPTPPVPPEGAIAHVPEPIVGRRVEGDEYNQIQADLSREADTLNRKMAMLSNQLHLVLPTVNCPELVKPILVLKAQIEAIWDKKRFLERNHVLPQEQPDQESPEEPLPTVGEASKFEWAYRKRRLIDLRSKLKTKLKNPKAKPGKRLEWETELRKAELLIQEIEVQLI